MAAPESKVAMSVSVRLGWSLSNLEEREVVLMMLMGRGPTQNPPVEEKQAPLTVLCLHGFERNYVIPQLMTWDSNHVAQSQLG
jgi:hypothetical protein